MTHGTPDWNVTGGKKTTYQLNDMGELAVRLGSIVNFDRLGEVFLLDDFEASALKCATITTGTGAAVALSSAAAKSGSQSCKLTTGNAEDNLAGIQRRSYLPVSGQFGFEYSFALGSDLKRLWSYGYAYDGVSLHSPSVRYNPQLDTLEYMDSGGSWVNLDSGLDLCEMDVMFHSMKLVFDFANQEYIRLRLDEKTYNLAGIAYQTGANAAAPRFDAVVAAINNAAGNHYAYIDDIIITQNEP